VLLFDSDFTDPPAFDTAVSHALLLQVARGEMDSSLRLHRPGSIVAFGRQDVVTDGYSSAVAAARAHGYAPVERLAGGRAAVFHQGTLAFSVAVPVDDPRAGIMDRFQLVAGIMKDAFRSLGADARVGEVPGEYCPGSYSVNVGGDRKVMGVGQRIVSRAAHIGGVVVVEGGDRIAEVLIPVYEALGLDWDPSTSGDLSSTGATLSDVHAAILAEFRNHHDLTGATIGSDTLALAADLVAQHVPSSIA